VAALSSVQISPQQQESTPKISYAKGGNFTRVTLPSGIPPVVRGDRECISGFSSKSRRAMLQVVNSIDRGSCEAGQFAFGTLTYPKEFPTAGASKRQLDQLVKRFEREWGHRWLIWKLEPQLRGAPHYHLLIYMGAGFDAFKVAKFCSWVARAWHEIAGAGDPNHLKWHLGQLGNRPCVEQVRDWQGVANYAGKYLGKTSEGDEEWTHPGRYWGQRRSELAPITIITHDVDRAVAIKYRRVVVRLYEKQPTGWFYESGKQTLRGKHLPGRRIHRRELAPGGEVSKLTTEWLALRVELLERQIRPQFRRWAGRMGGASMFMAAATSERLLAWARCPSPSRPRIDQVPDPWPGPTKLDGRSTPPPQTCRAGPVPRRPEPAAATDTPRRTYASPS
jgi:hypothetical protein